jgi:SOS-response transcriptional repressor LexA
LQFIFRSIQHNHYPPTMREIMQGLGYRTTSGAHYQVLQLVERGCLGHDVARARGLWITEYGGTLVQGEAG